MKESFIYNSGDVFLPKWVKRLLDVDLFGSSKKTFYVSGWSIWHFINGILFGSLYLLLHYDTRHYFFTMFILHTCWELWQVFIGMAKPNKFVGSGNLIDSIIDTVCFMLGAYLLYVHVISAIV